MTQRCHRLLHWNDKIYLTELKIKFSYTHINGINDKFMEARVYFKSPLNLTKPVVFV